MAKLISDLGITKVWVKLLGTLLDEGAISSPRDQKTKEILNMTVEVRWGLENVIVSPVRDLNYKFMVAEWLWIMAGLNGVDILAKYNSVMRNFSDDGHILSGAYGPRLMPQMDYVIENLKKQDSRQAVATIWTPNPQNSKDIPCTISVQWLIRPNIAGSNRLNCIVNMRSSDAWLGLPYDYYTFSQITNWLGLKVGCPVGSVTFNLGSSHLYERDWAGALKVMEDEKLNTVGSPDFFDSEFLPIKKEDFQNMLHIPEKMANEGPEPWIEYAEILASPRSHSLEVLRGLTGQQI